MVLVIFSLAFRLQTFNSARARIRRDGRKFPLGEMPRPTLEDHIQWRHSGSILLYSAQRASRVRLHLRKELETEPLHRPAWHLLLVCSYLRITPVQTSKRKCGPLKSIIMCPCILMQLDDRCLFALPCRNSLRNNKRLPDLRPSLY